MYFLTGQWLGGQKGFIAYFKPHYMKGLVIKHKTTKICENYLYQNKFWLTSDKVTTQQVLLKHSQDQTMIL